MSRRSPFEPVLLVSHEAISQEPVFSARSFAVDRAGFLLREFERQQSSSIGEAEASPVAAVPALSAEEEQRLVDTAKMEQDARELQLRVDESYKRGREEALAQLGTALDTAISAMDEVARGFAARQQELELNLVVPLAKAAVEMAGQLARQRLAEPDALAAYVETVIASSAGPGNEVSGPMTVHMNPADIETLKRATTPLSHLSLVGDDLVVPGGASLRVMDKVVDDRFENRMRDVREAALAIAADLSRRGRE